MQRLEHIRIAQKPTAVLMTVVIGGLCANLLPQGWEIISRLGLAASFFAAGVLVSQHVAIWEKGQTIRRRPNDKP